MGALGETAAINMVGGGGGSDGMHGWHVCRSGLGWTRELWAPTRGLVRQPTAEPRQAAGAEAALCQVVHAACLLGLFADDDCVAPGVTRCTVVSLISTRRWRRLSGVVATWHGLLRGAIVVAAGGRWLTPRWVVPCWWHEARLTSGHVGRPLLYVTLSSWVEDGSLWLLRLRWGLLWCLWRRNPSRLWVSVIARVRVIRWRGIIGHLGK